jgi:hypothetical protein
VEHRYAPGKILGFVSADIDDLNGGPASPLPHRVMAVVSTCDFPHSQESVFSTKWQQSYVFHAGNRKTPNIQLVDVNAIVHHCLMVPHNADQSSYHEL